MKLRMAENSVFAILLRSPWWISFLAAAGIFALTRLVIPEIYALFVPLPFVVIGAIAAWRQLRAPSPERIAATLEELRAVSWDVFSAALEDGLRREGWSVSRIAGSVAEFELARAGRTALVGCKRWKVARTGIEPLRDLDALRRTRDAHEAIYVAAGEITANAAGFAAANAIRLIHGAELARMIGAAARKAG